MLADGRLVRLAIPRPGPHPEHAFWLLHAEAPLRPEVAAVVAWVREEAAGGSGK